MTVSSLVLGLLLVAPAAASSPEDSLSHRAVFPAGISVEYGLGAYSVRDEYISREKYSGTLPTIGVQWTRRHRTYCYHLNLNYRHSKDIDNYNVSTSIYQFTLHQGFLYPLSRGSLFSRDLFVFLGPSTDLHFFSNEPQIAVTGFDYAQSYAALLSLGLHTRVIVPLGRGFQTEGQLGFGVLSLGMRMVDDEEEDVSPVKPLTAFAGTNLLFRLGVRYHLFGAVSLKGSYALQMTRISAWEPLLAVSDNLIVTVTYGL
jgi:hypothetical protein